MLPTRPAENHARLGTLASLALLALVLAGRLAAIHACPIYDDAFITYRYARNLAAGHGLVYQPGAPWEPVLGTTTPGYALWLALWIRLGVPAPTASLATNVVCDLVTAALLLRALRARPLVATLAVAGFACLPELGRISAGGMELPMLAALSLAVALALERGRTRLAALGAVLAGTLRPEALILAALLALSARRRGETRRFLVPLFVAGGAYVGFLWAWYASPIPQSVIAKAARHSDNPALDALGSILRQAFLPRLAYLPAALLALLGLARAGRAPAELGHVVRFALGIVLSYLCARPHTWGWYYYLPLLAWIVALAFGAELVLSRARGPRLERVAPFAAAGLGLLALGIAAFRQHDRVTETVYRPLAAWARTASPAAEGAAILASDIGAVGYFSGAEILDTEGLVWPEAVESHGGQAEWIEAHSPRYLWITATRSKVEALKGERGLVPNYELVCGFGARATAQTFHESGTLPTSWVQAYFLLERVPALPSSAAPPAASTTSSGSSGKR
jgi:hypothetical protein